MELVKRKTVEEQLEDLRLRVLDLELRTDDLELQIADLKPPEVIDPDAHEDPPEFTSGGA